MFTIDRIGRRHTLVWGSIVMGLLMLLAGFSSQSALIHSSAATNHYGIAAVVCIVSFTATFGATWLTVPWLYPAEIFPLQIRAQGNAWGVVGWSIGNAMLTILCPSKSHRPIWPLPRISDPLYSHVREIRCHNVFRLCHLQRDHDPHCLGTLS